MPYPSPVSRLAGFAAVLAFAGGGAALAGSVWDVHPGRASAAAGMAGHGSEMAVEAVRGLAVSDDGLTLALDRTRAPQGRRFDLGLRILDRGGDTQRAFDVEHTRRMHVILVRRDLRGFQHVHPVQRPDGSWHVPVALPEAGAYRVFADFSAGGQARTLAGDLNVDGAVRTAALPAPARSTTVDGLRVALGEGATRAGAESGLSFTVTRNGQAVPVRDYLGAKGHLVALRDGDLAFLHVHPDARRLRFGATFPTPGRYRLFLQFRTADGLHTAAFTQEVAR